MHGSLASNAVLLEALKAGVQEGGATRAGVCVPAPYLAQTKALLAGSALLFGAQDVSEHASGAYTGEVAGAMVAEFGAQLAIVGHSERRALHGETSDVVARKAVAAVKAGLMPIVCVGETLAQREADETFNVVEAQLRAVLECGDALGSEFVVAYEPVWAIGTGKTATPEQAQEVHAFIRVLLRDAGREATPVLYGGSVKAANAAGIFSMPDIDGGLIGGASLVAQDFLAIIAASNAVAEG
jgi:triosephosphate isomerase (TIM)